MLSIGTEVTVGFNPMPEEERKRLTDARSTGRQTTKIHKSKVDQICHQTSPHPGVIEGIIKKNEVMKYIVRVYLENSPGGRLREYPVDSPLITAE